jgi:hypothetical protein
MSILEDLSSDHERVYGLQNLLISHATGGNGSDTDYVSLRHWMINHKNLSAIVPSFIRTNRDLHQFWQYIKLKFGTYAERRSYIYQEFQPLLDYTESRGGVPSEAGISEVLKGFNEDGVHLAWQKALDRRSNDPEGAITSARTLLEATCKNILDESQVTYKPNIELPELYKLVAERLNLAASQHTEGVFKQILGGCSGVVSGLGSLRNKIGDAHGQGKVAVRPLPRHAELAVNLSGAMALFLVSTWVAANEKNDK